jgi:Holliday junction resolvase RusA-like endonuclease
VKVPRRLIPPELLAGARVLGIKLPPGPRPAPAPVHLLARADAADPGPWVPAAGWRWGKRVASFWLPGTAVPWSVPRQIRRKSPRLIAWQAEVKQAATRAMGGRPPHEGLVGVRLVVCRRMDGRRTPPDLTNILKAAEDSCQGAVFVNDRQVRAHDAEYHFDFDGPDRIRVEVHAIHRKG